MKPMAYYHLSIATTVSTLGCVAPGALPSATHASSLRECGPQGLLDDFEDNDAQASPAEDRGGYWYTYSDKSGSKVWPEPGETGGTFEVSPGGHNNSKFAARMRGKLAPGPVVYAALGVSLTDPREPYDASRYEGITFYARRGAAATAQARVKLPDGNTDPEGQVCSDCYNDYGVTLVVGEQWQRFVLPFRDMKQAPNWGAPRRPHIDSKRLIAINWEVNTPGADFDLWVDDLAFICKP